MIEAEGLSKSFGGTRALNGVSFEIAAGEIVGLLGPNASGKTTLLRILTAFFPADEGRAVVAGISLDDDAREVRRRIGFLPEQAPLYPELSVEALLRFAADVKIEAAATRKGRIEAVLAECGLADVRRRPIGALSKGYRQRVGIAQALIGRPQVLILDEPTAGLDPAQVLELRALIDQLGGRTTILLSSHILADVASVCSRVLVLHRGRLVRDERIETLQREVRKSGEIVLRTRAEPARVEAILGGLDAVLSVSTETDPDGAVSAHLVHGSGGSDAESRRIGERVADAAARALIAAGLPVLEIGPRTRSLEDLFVDLLAEERR